MGKTSCGNFIEDVMKKRMNVRTAAIALALALTVGVTAMTVYAAYDSGSDPLISFSYLQKYKTEEIDPELLVLQEQILLLQAQIQSMSGSTAQPEFSSLEEYEVKEVHAGDRIYASMATDIMLRAGGAVAIVPAEAGGDIADYTDGSEIGDGEAIPANHMLLIPRGDGRGILITTDVAYIMVRGSVTIEQ